MNVEFVNPPEKLEEREYQNIQEIASTLQEILHTELSNSKQGAYCATCHSLETRCTKAKHSQCKVYTTAQIKGNLVNHGEFFLFLGKTSVQRWESFLVIVDKHGYKTGNNMKPVFVRKLKKHAEKVNEDKLSSNASTSSQNTMKHFQNTTNSQLQSQFQPLIQHPIFDSLGSRSFPTNFGVQCSQSQFLPYLPFQYPGAFSQISDFSNNQQNSRAQNLLLNMIEEVKVDFHDRLAKIEKQQTQQENILNQLVTEIRNLRPNKNKKKENSRQEGISQEICLEQDEEIIKEETEKKEPSARRNPRRTRN